MLFERGTGEQVRADGAVEEYREHAAEVRGREGTDRGRVCTVALPKSFGGAQSLTASQNYFMNITLYDNEHNSYSVW